MVSPCYSYAAPMFAGFGMPALVTLWLECAPSWRAMHLPGKQETWQVFNLTWLASRGGAIENPAWYHNLKANPACTLTVRGQPLECTAREVSGEERDRYWRAAVANYSGFARYQTRTNRAIPVIVLTPTNS
jgi:deazaflavin-dependent oxidoreductase (nitroreductase family)